MKVLSVYGCICVALFSGCSKSSPQIASVDWFEGSRPLEDYVSKINTKKIVVLFWVEGWDPMGAAYQKVLDDNLEALGAEEYFFLIYNCAGPSTIGVREISKLGISYVPVVVVIETATDKWKMTPKIDTWKMTPKIDTVEKLEEKILFNLKQVFNQSALHP